MMKLCFEGWKEEDGNKNGSCCCNASINVLSLDILGTKTH